MVLPTAGVNVTLITKGFPEPDKVIVPVPVAKVAPLAIVKTPATPKLGLLATPVAPALALSPIVKLPAILLRVPGRTKGVAPAGFRFKCP